MKKMAITGVGGFIGSNVYKYFNDAGYKIVLISSSAQIIEENSALDFDNLTINDLTGVDVVVHCAGIAHRKDSHDMGAFSEYFEFNSLKTIDLWNKSKEAGVKQFIYLSSANVCKLIDSKISSTSELQPLDINSFSKVVAERMIQLQSNEKIEFTIIRCPLVYGAGVKGNFLALNKLVNNLRLLPFGCFGNVKRSMVSIYNLLDLLDKCVGNAKASNQIFLVSDGHDISFLEFIRLICKLKGRRVFMLPIPILLLSLLGALVRKRNLIDNLSKNFQIDIMHTKRTLGWEPPFDVEQSLKKFVNKVD